MSDGQDYLEHYGKKGMKWGVRRKMRDAEIKNARGRQAGRKEELKGLKKEKLRADSVAGREHLNKVISEKKFEIKNGSDAAMAKKKTTGQQVLKGAVMTTVLGYSAATVVLVAQAGKMAADMVNEAANMEDFD